MNMQNIFLRCSTKDAYSPAKFTDKTDICWHKWLLLFVRNIMQSKESWSAVAAAKSCFMTGSRTTMMVPFAWTTSVNALPRWMPRRKVLLAPRSLTDVAAREPVHATWRRRLWNSFNSDWHPRELNIHSGKQFSGMPWMEAAGEASSNFSRARRCPVAPDGECARLVEVKESNTVSSYFVKASNFSSFLNQLKAFM